MPPATLQPLPIVYCDKSDVVAVMSAEAVYLRQDHDDNSILDSDEEFLIDRAINYATSVVNRYALGRYPPQELSKSWEVNYWTTVIAVRYLCMTRLQPCPASIAQLYMEVIEALTAVKTGQFQLEDIAPRNVDWPAWSNSRVDHRYWLRKIRVAKPISEPTPTKYRQHRDIPADYIVEP